MLSIPSLVKQLEKDYSHFTFIESDDFSWSFVTQTVSYQPAAESSQQQLLHELAHGLLEHKAYERDIQLIDMEREAWTYARDYLSARYSVPIQQKTEQLALDSYRDWMHARSTCPACHATGIETTKTNYQCLACAHRWRVNEARICGLKRYDIKK